MSMKTTTIQPAENLSRRTILKRGGALAGTAALIGGSQLLDNGDGLMTEGTEGGIYTLRSVVGGYGAYIAAAGQCGETQIGDNETMRVITPEIVIPVANLAFDFELVS